MGVRIGVCMGVLRLCVCVRACMLRLSLGWTRLSVEHSRTVGRHLLVRCVVTELRSCRTPPQCSGAACAGEER